LVGRVDPHRLGEFRGLRHPLHEALRVSGVCGGQDLFALFADSFSQAVVDDGRGEESQGAVVVLVVVPGEEDVTEGTAVLDRAEAL
jgi:hypothetical protein